jgi:hypothetical protein
MMLLHPALRSRVITAWRSKVKARGRVLVRALERSS